MTLSIRCAESTDVPAARLVYRRIIDHLAKTVDFPHWHTENHPTPDEVAEWVAAGDLFLALADEGSIAGAVVLNHDAVDAYQTAAWAIEAAANEVLVIHALGVAPDHLGQGVARFLVESAIDVAEETGCRAVRLDTYVENVPARKLYSRCGFTDLGCHTVDYEGTDLSEFHLFEYVL